MANLEQMYHILQCGETNMTIYKYSVENKLCYTSVLNLVYTLKIKRYIKHEDKRIILLEKGQKLLDLFKANPELRDFIKLYYLESNYRKALREKRLQTKLENEKKNKSVGKNESSPIDS